MTLFKNKHDWVFLFPGIGVQPFGRECEFYAKYQSIIQPFLHMSSEKAGVDLSESLLEKTTFEQDQLSRELFAYSFSYGTFKVFQQLGLRPHYLAGHSLGVYAALAASGAVSFEDGLAITEKAHKLGRACCPQKKFGVVVIIGLDKREVAGIIEDCGYLTVNLANHNNDCSGVYVGHQDEIEELRAAADNLGAIKAIRLRIDIPFHNPQFMEKTSKKLKIYLDSIHWHEPRCPIISALDHSLCTSVKELIAMTAANLARPIHWPGVMARLNQLDVESVIECGHGVSLSQHARFIDTAPKHYNLKNLRRRLDY